MIQATIQPAETGAAIYDHMAMILRLKAVKFDLACTRKFSLAELSACCGRVSSLFPGIELRHESIQRELIQNPDFASWLAQFRSEIKAPHMTWLGLEARLSDLLEDCQANQRGVTAYAQADVLAALEQERLTSHRRLVWLENFAPVELSDEDGIRIMENLCTCIDVPVALDEEQKALLREPFVMGRRLFSVEPFEKITELFSFCPELADIARMLFQNNINEGLTLRDYIYFAEDAPEYHRLLSIAIQRLGGQYAAEFIYFWQRNSCALSELRRMEYRTRDAGQDWDNVFSAYSGYVNLLYGTRFKTIDFHSTASYQEDVLTYAIIHNKKHFIRLVDENSELFCSLPHNSILFWQDMYQGHFNLNELTAKDLADCRWMVQRKLAGRLFSDRRQYTFPELKLLYDAPQAYAALYGKLRSNSLDYRLGVLRQLRKRGALDSVERDEDLSILAGRFDQKPLHSWRQGEFGHIEGLAAGDMVQMLIHMEKLAHLLPDIRNGIDAALALRCLEHLEGFDSIGALKASLLQTDEDWHALADAMALTPEFIGQYRETIIDFLSKDGAGIAMEYQERLSSDQRQAFFRVVKAELMGRFGALKYYEGDLERELDCPVPPQVKSSWPQNLSTARDGMTAWERDDFFSTIQLGTQPHRTCLSYKDGGYSHCLLACFDSNKKTFYVEKCGRIVDRASIRLTKYCLGEKSSEEDDFSFVDLEDIAGTRRQERPGERVTLFLERPYISGVGPEDQLKVQRVMIDLAGQKAEELGVALVLSADYRLAIPTGFTQVYLKVYISASKAGAQYLDSLGGSSSVSSEKSYRGNRFLMKQDADVQTAQK